MKYLPETFPYINEPTDFNLQIETPEKYFVPTTTDVKKHIEVYRTCRTIQEENSWKYYCGSI